MQFTSLIAAEPGWKALYGRDGLEESRSRIVAWALAEGGERIVGIVVDPADPAKLVAAPDVVDADGSTLIRYGFAGSAPPPAADPLGF